jgi:hypothetical protein
MIDIMNFQLFGFPVLIYGMMGVTAGALTYATVLASSDDKPNTSTPAPAVQPTPEQNTSLLPNIPSSIPNPFATPAPPQTPFGTGGKRRKNKTAKSSRSTKRNK